MFNHPIAQFQSPFDQPIQTIVRPASCMEEPSLNRRAAASVQITPSTPFKLVAFGDSQTNSVASSGKETIDLWGTVNAVPLEKSWADFADESSHLINGVTNLSYGGSTASGTKGLPDQIKQYKSGLTNPSDARLHIAGIWFGTNDSRQNIPKAQTIAALADGVVALKKLGVTKFVIFGLDHEYYGSSYTEELKKAMQPLTCTAQIKVIDVHDVVQSLPARGLREDKIHFTLEAEKALGKAVAQINWWSDVWEFGPKRS